MPEPAYRFAVDEGGLEATAAHDRRKTFSDDAVPRLRASPDDAVLWGGP